MEDHRIEEGLISSIMWNYDYRYISNEKQTCEPFESSSWL